MTSYLAWLRTQRGGTSVEAVDAGDADLGLGALRQHAALWRALRSRGAKFCEVRLA